MFATKFFLAVLSAAAISGATLQEVAFIGSAKVREVTGKAELLENDKWSALKPGATLPIGAKIRTGAGAGAVIELSESGALVKVTPLTNLRLAHPSEAPAFAQSHEDVPSGGCVVRGLRGKAEVKRGLWWANLEVGDVLERGARLRTREATAVDLLFPGEHKMVRVGTSTLLRVDAREIGDKTMIGRSPFDGAEAVLTLRK